MSISQGTRMRALLGLCAVALVAGCGSGQSASPVGDIGRSIGGLVRDSGLRSNVLGAENLSASDAQLRRYGQPLIRVTRADQGLSAGLLKSDDKGAAVIWRSTDGKTVTLFNGLLIATRGFGDDLSSAKVPSVKAGTSDVLREHYYLGGDEVMRRQGYFCSFRDGGRTTINLVGVPVKTSLVEESCAGERDSFQNSYWFGDGGGIVKSVQWASPEIGPLVIEYVPQDSGPAVAAPVIQQQLGRPGVTVISGSLD